MKKLITFPVMFAFLVAICAMNSAQAGGWKKSYHAGSFDRNFRYLGGTEIMSIVSHKGKLYAATGMLLNSTPLADSISAQILVKESPRKKWKLDYQTGKQIVRVDSLASITLSTDGQGNQLSQPVNLLVAGLWDVGTPQPAAVTVAVRDDATNKWITTDLFKFPTNNQAPIRAIAMQNDRIISADQVVYTGFPIRTIGTHKDKITGVDYVFAAFVGMLYRGVYDSTVSGKIRWESKPEVINVADRLMSFAECNGDLYAAIKPAIYKRIDGATPAWEKVYEYTTDPGDKPSGQGGLSGMRGLTAIPNPKGDGEVLLMALEGLTIEGISENARIVYLDPSDNSVTTEIDLATFLKEQLKDKLGTDWNYVCTAYNDMTWVTDPKTSENLLLIGFSVNELNYNSAWYLVRHPDATYTVHEIPYIFDFRGQPKRLQGTRTIIISPFAADNGQVLYFGGFVTYSTSQNTAWIYSVDINTALGISK